MPLGARRDPRGWSWGSASRGHTGERWAGVAGFQRGCVSDWHRQRMAAPHLVLSGAASYRLSGDPAYPCQPPPDSPGPEHSRAASSTRPRPFMAAGNMLQAGLRKAWGLQAGVVWGTGLAGRSLDQETKSRPSSKDPPLLWHPNATSSPESRARGRPGALKAPPPAHPPEHPPSLHSRPPPSPRKIGLPSPAG